jgi:hypothetical protein
MMLVFRQSSTPGGHGWSVSALLWVGVKDDPFSVLSREHVERVCRELGHTWRDSTLDPVKTVALFVQQIASGNLSIDELRRQAKCSCTSSAYCQARSRLPLSVLQKLGDQVHRSVAAIADGQAAYQWHGHRCFFVDGSSLSMPDTDELREFFGQPTEQREGCGFPVGHLLALFDGRTGSLSGPILSPLYTSDQKHLPLVHEKMIAGDLLCGDTAFSGWAHFALILRGGLHAVMPNHQNRIVSFTPRRRHASPRHDGSGKGLPRSRWIRSLGRKDQLVEWFKPTACPRWMDPDDYARLPGSIIVREVQRTIRRKGFRPLTVIVVTTLLDAELYPADDLVELRMQRWEAETNLGHLKTTMGMDVLRCKTVAGVQKETAVFALVYNLVRVVMMEASRRQEVPVDRISFADTLYWLRYCQPGEALPDLTLVPYRPNRVEPRAVKRRPKEYDLLRKPRKQLQIELREGAKYRGKQR